MSDPEVTQWGKARAVAGFRALSMLGSELTLFTLVLRERGEGATFVSALFALGTIPLILMVPIAGWISDRFSTRQIIPITSLAQGALVISLIYQHEKFLLALTIFLASSCGAIENPTLMALMPTLVSKEDYTKQMGFSQSLYAIAGLAGPALGGVLVSQTGYKTCFVIDALTFIALALAPTLLGVNRRVEFADENSKVKASEGMRFILGDRFLRSLAVLIAAFLFAAGTLTVANIYLITQVLHASVFIYGMSGAASALGMLSGGIALMKFNVGEEQRSRVIVVVLVSVATGMLLMSLAGYWWIVILLNFLIGALISILTALISTIFIQSSPSEMRGRIGAALNAFINVGMVGSLLLSGPLLDWLGTRRLLFIAGIAALVLIASFSPALFREKLISES